MGAVVEQGASSSERQMRQAILPSTAMAAEPGSRSLAQQLLAAMRRCGQCQEHQLEEQLMAAAESDAIQVQHFVFYIQGSVIDAASLTACQRELREQHIWPHCRCETKNVHKFSCLPSSQRYSDL